jgi:Alpha/beta hydrolase family
LLTEQGYEVRIPDLTGALEAGEPYCSRQAGLIAGSAMTGPATPVVLIGHSGAGALLAPAGRRVRQLAGYVFVDAGLPIPGHTPMSTMPPELAEQLKQMADPGGWLPPWPQWWGDDGLAELIGDPEARSQFEAQCPKLPLAMFDEEQPTGDVEVPAGYLRLSEAYDGPAARARELLWPLIELDSHHLAPLTEPGRVTSALLDLLDRIAASVTR